MRTVAEIQADLDAAYASRRAALQAQGYSLDTGQGKQMVNRANLSDINRLIRDLEAERDAAVAGESGQTGITSGNFERY